MNAQNAHEYLPLVQALADGKTIQSTIDGVNWLDMNDLKCTNPPEYYRIKPEPRTFEIYVNKSSGSTRDAYDAIPADCEKFWERITVQEVLK